MTVEAWSFLRLGDRQSETSKNPFPTALTANHAHASMMVVYELEEARLRRGIAVAVALLNAVLNWGMRAVSRTLAARVPPCYPVVTVTNC